jgi:hypothetical protein
MIRTPRSRLTENIFCCSTLGPSGIGAPKQILKKLPTHQGTPTFQSMPDSRHIVVALASEQNAPTHLWIADVESNDLMPLTTGTANESSPTASPDGLASCIGKVNTNSM